MRGHPARIPSLWPRIPNPKPPLLGPKKKTTNWLLNLLPGWSIWMHLVGYDWTCCEAFQGCTTHPSSCFLNSIDRSRLPRTRCSLWPLPGRENYASHRYNRVRKGEQVPQNISVNQNDCFVRTTWTVTQVTQNNRPEETLEKVYRVLWDAWSLTA